jgi:hypothetical protein
MLGRIDLAGSQLTHRQLNATKDIQGQAAVVMVIVVEKTAFLATIHRIIRGIEVENRLIRRLVIGSDVLLQLMEPLINSWTGACRLKRPGSALKGFAIAGYYARFSLPISALPGIHQRLLQQPASLLNPCPVRVGHRQAGFHSVH